MSRIFKALHVYALCADYPRIQLSKNLTTQHPRQAHSLSRYAVLNARAITRPRGKPVRVAWWR